MHESLAGHRPRPDQPDRPPEARRGRVARDRVVVDQRRPPSAIIYWVRWARTAGHLRCRDEGDECYVRQSVDDHLAALWTDSVPGHLQATAILSRTLSLLIAERRTSSARRLSSAKGHVWTAPSWQGLFAT